MMDGETFFSVKGYSQPRNIGFYVKECLVPEMASATGPHSRVVGWDDVPHIEK